MLRTKARMLRIRSYKRYGLSFPGRDFMGTAARDAPVRLSGLSYETTKNIIALANGHIAPFGADPKDPASDQEHPR